MDPPIRNLEESRQTFYSIRADWQLGSSLNHEILNLAELLLEHSEFLEQKLATKVRISLINGK